ncbi:MAG: hypothetical protein KDC92_02910 [Bacteroidetes bacterium]|nr:hypothetical protein [Bacteroidota bacterium]
MQTKLTLTIDRDIIEMAKKYAKLKNRSLSKIIENYMKGLSSEMVKSADQSAQITSSLKGAFKTKKDFDYKTELKRRIDEKYGS